MRRGRSRRFDLVVIGGGSAGIVAARIAAGLGARVALAERDRVGGECLHTGCVPSKALLASAARAHAVRTAGRLGIEAGPPRVDFARVIGHVREAIAAAGAEDTPEFLRGLGIEVIEAEARFLGPGAIEAGGRPLRYRAALVATGSRPASPPIPGLEAVGALTNETVFELERQPRRLAVIGGGATGCELGQAFARLGTEVTVIEAEDRLLAGEEPEASALIAAALAEDGVRVLTGARIERVTDTGHAARLELRGGAGLEADRVLVAAGRVASADGLGLETVGVRRSPAGAIEVDARMRTTGDRIFAAGDVTGELELTHFAAYQALVAVANALFRARRRVERRWIPWATFTDPELARVGLTERQARERHGDAVEVFAHDLARNDRAIAAGTTRGRAKLVADRRGRLLGATLVAPAAGEAIGEAARLVRDRATVADLSQMVHVYPTIAESPARAADAFFERRYLTPAARRLLRPVLGVLRVVDRPRRRG